MPLIIVATDFSDLAENAVNYACNLALSQNAQVNVIHTFIIPVMFSDIPMPGSLITDAQNDADNQMSKLIEDLTNAYPQLTITGKVIYGDTVNVIDEYSEDGNEPWMIVVGNSSAGEQNTWPDSTLIDAFRKLKYPVLAIPSGATYKPVKKICLAFDNKHAGNDIALGQLTAIAADLSADLHVINAVVDARTQENNPDIDSTAKKLLEPADPHYHFIFQSENIDQVIQDYNDINEIDWLVMIPRKHSFFEGLFHKSHTKSIAHHSRIPILALHESNV